MADKRLIPELQQELETTAERSGCELLHVDFRGGVLRLVLDREGGVTLKECESVAREVSALLDVEDFGMGRYTLEVSSPGLDRPLYRLSDYERFAGSLAKVTWNREDGKRTDLVRIESVTGEGVDTAIEVANAESSQRWKIPFSQIIEARLDPEF